MDLCQSFFFKTLYTAALPHHRSTEAVEGGSRASSFVWFHIVKSRRTDFRWWQMGGKQIWVSRYSRYRIHIWGRAGLTDNTCCHREKNTPAQKYEALMSSKSQLTLDRTRSPSAGGKCSPCCPERTLQSFWVGCWGSGGTAWRKSYRCPADVGSTSSPPAPPTADPPSAACPGCGCPPG